MSTNVVKLRRSGTPAMLLENAAELADDMEIMLMVFVTKDGDVHTEWSYLPSNLQAMGAVEMLRTALAAEAAA